LSGLIANGVRAPLHICLGTRQIQKAPFARGFRERPEFNLVLKIAREKKLVIRTNSQSNESCVVRKRPDDRAIRQGPKPDGTVVASGDEKPTVMAR